MSVLACSTELDRGAIEISENAWLLASIVGEIDVRTVRDTMAPGLWLSSSTTNPRNQPNATAPAAFIHIAPRAAKREDQTDNMAFVHPEPGFARRIQLHQDTKQTCHIYLARLPGFSDLLNAVRLDRIGRATCADLEKWSKQGIVDEVQRLVASKHTRREDNAVTIDLQELSIQEVQ